MAKLEDIILRGVFGSRPSAGVAGRLYYATDYGIHYRDNGSSWDALLDITSLTADASPDGAADYVATYDASAGYLKKVLISNLPSSGGGGSSAAVGCRIKRASGDLSFDTTGAAIAFDAEDDDTDGFHDNSTNNTRMTVPTGAAGVYLIGAQAYSAQDYDLRARLNGSAYIGLVRTAGVSVVAPVLSTVYRLAEGDYIEIVGRGLGGSATIIYDAGVSPVAWMYRIGE